MGQSRETALFADNSPLDIKLKISIKDVKAIKNDTIYTSSVMHYKVGDKWDSMKIDIRARGNYRRKECYYPPLRIKIKKGAAKGTIFEGNKSLKLVMPCRISKDNTLIMKEFLCYKMYEPITKYTFSTRLVNIDFTDEGNKKSKQANLIGFFIEDDDLVAKRNNGKVVENLNLHPKYLEDSSAARHDIFQYMIANTDWSTTFLHNAKVIQLTDTKKYVPLAYDFDMAGFVNAPYATADPSLNLTSVQQRLFRGFCRSEDIFQAIRKEYLNKETLIMAELDKYKSSFEPKDYNAIVKYMDEFFDTFKSDAKFRSEIIGKCRNK
jgi:hypothetical protein